jgi:hypothetical protein
LGKNEKGKWLMRSPYMAGGSFADVMTQYHESKQHIPEQTLIAWYTNYLSILS